MNWGLEQLKYALNVPTHDSLLAEGSTVFLELFETLRPILLQKPREGPIGEELPSGLADGTVVCLIRGEDDPLNRRSTRGARLSMFSVDRHFGTKRGHLFGKPFPHLLAKSLGPVEQSAPRRFEEGFDLGLGELLSERHRRESRAVENLIGVRVSDPAEQSRIRERAAQRVIAQGQPLAEGGKIAGEEIETSRIERAECVAPLDDVERSALLRSGFGEEESAGCEVEGRELDLSLG